MSPHDIDNLLEQARCVSVAISLGSFTLAAALALGVPFLPTRWRDDDDLPPPTACVTSPRRPKPGHDGASAFVPRVDELEHEGLGSRLHWLPDHHREPCLA